MITEITRNAVFNRIQSYWNGQLDPIKFLERIYALDELPSVDSRFETFRQDIIQHTVNNDDWDDTWIFSDKRLALDETDNLLNFLVQVFHPAVSPDIERTIQHVREVNQILQADGYEFFESGHISGHPIWSHRRIRPQIRPTGPIPDSIIAAVSTVLSNRYSHSELDTLFELHDIPRPANFGSNKQTKAKAWIAQLNKSSGIDRWSVLGEVLKGIMEGSDPSLDAEKAESDTRDILVSFAKKGLIYQNGGAITKQVAGLSDRPPPVSETEIAPWILEKNKIGEGGFGKVYRYEDRRLELNFAIKVYDPHPFQNDPERGKQRFFREASLLFKLRNRYIVQIYDAGELSDGRPFIKMEYFPGFSLSKYLEQAGNLSPLNRMIVIGRIANALSHAHEQKVMHRDLKPTNVLIDSNGYDIRLIDFGLGLLIEDNIGKTRLTATKDGLGNSVYLAPELLENAKLLDPKSDVYSLGAVWFRLLTGVAPRGVGMEQMLAEVSATVAEKDLIRACLDLQPQRRPESSKLVEKMRELVQRERKNSKT